MEKLRIAVAFLFFLGPTFEFESVDPDPYACLHHLGLPFLPLCASSDVIPSLISFDLSVQPVRLRRQLYG
jgi:hypothetical protein